MTSKGRQFMDLIEAPEILITPGVYDGYSARLVEKAGYRTGAISGACLSESHLGWADMGIMGFEENLRACRAIAACTDLLLTADADTGYGNAINVHFVVRAFEDAGLAGVMIEDQVWPKRCGHLAGKQVIDADEMVQKIKAAANARSDPHFAIKARTDAVAVFGVDEAIRRLNLYAEAGADFLFADALLSAEDIEKVASGVTKPMTVNMGLGIRSRPTTPLLTPRQLQDMGVAGVTYPRMLATAAVRGMMNALTAFEESVADNQTVDRPDLTVSFDEVNELMGLGMLKALEERFVAGPPGEAAAPAGQSQAGESE